MKDEEEQFYRDNARQCLRWARKATNEENREAFVNLARTWLTAATHRVVEAQRQADGPQPPSLGF